MLGVGGVGLFCGRGVVCVMGHIQTRKNTNKQEKHLSSKGYLPIKCKSLQVVGISGQGKAVVSDGG